MPDGDDFKPATRRLANCIHAWNGKYAWPRLVCGRFEMFFDAIAKQAKPSDIKTFALDSNNQWSDQDYAAARATGQARRLTESLPAIETLASVTQALAGGGDQWIDLFQGYHRLLQYWEHTNAKDLPYGNMTWYETELEENREMVAEAAGYQQQVFARASQRLADAIARSGEENLVVFNPLPHPRSDVVRTELPQNLAPLDPATGRTLPVQHMPDGSAIFVVPEIPAVGYKVFALAHVSGTLRVPEESGTRSVPNTLDSRYYRLQVNPATGALTSLFDKTLGAELIDQHAPHAFNEYLYELRTHTTGLKYDSVIEPNGKGRIGLDRPRPSRRCGDGQRQGQRRPRTQADRHPLPWFAPRRFRHLDGQSTVPITAKGAAIADRKRPSLSLCRSPCQISPFATSCPAA